MSSQSDTESVDFLISEISKCLNGTPSSSRNASAVRKLIRLRDAVAADACVDQPSLVLLVCTGLSCCRQNDTGLRKTALLIFVVVLMVYHGKGQEEREDPSPDSVYASLEDMLRTPGIGNDGELVAWSLGRGLAFLRKGTLDDLIPYASSFYRATERLMQLHALRSAGDGREEEDDECQFLSLSLHGLNDRIQEATGCDNPKVSVVVAAADSEAGQVVMRDLYLSFVLPIDFVGIRRGLLLPREIAHQATAEYPEATQEAHEVAMAGAVWLYRNSNQELRKLVSVLAGLACLTTKEGEDPIRKGVAFGGRVSLPFLETTAPTDPSVVRLVLDRWTNRWSLFRVSRVGVEVMGGGVGYRGLLTAAVGMLSTL